MFDVFNLQAIVDAMEKALDDREKKNRPSIPISKISQQDMESAMKNINLTLRFANGTEPSLTGIRTFLVTDG
jgi:hypothetical protein